MFGPADSMQPIDICTLPLGFAVDARASHVTGTKSIRGHGTSDQEIRSEFRNLGHNPAFLDYVAECERYFEWDDFFLPAQQTLPRTIVPRPLKRSSFIERRRIINRRHHFARSSYAFFVEKCFIRDTHGKSKDPQFCVTNTV